MKILQIAPHFPPTYVGGVELYTRRIADWLHSHGHVPTVICIERIDEGLEGHIACTVESERGYEVHRLSVNLGAADDQFLSKYHNTTVERWIAAFLDKARPDVLHLHSGYLLGGAVLSAARRNRVPTVVTLHDFWFICPRVTLLHPNGACCSGPESAAKCTWCLATEHRRWRLPDRTTRGAVGRAMIALLRRPSLSGLLGSQNNVERVERRQESLLGALAQAGAILAPSQFLRDQMDRAGFPANRITTHCFGMDNPPVSKGNPRTNDDAVRLGYLGQIAHRKGVHVLVEAVCALPDQPIEVRIYGQVDREPSYVARLQHLARGDSRISFRGTYEQSQIADVFAGLDAIVVPSVWYENSPLVIHEAHAASVPVIASNLGGMAELVDNDVDGLLFAAGDTGDLARQISRLVSDRTLLPRLRAGIRPVRMFPQEMAELTSLYHQLTAAIPAKQSSALDSSPQ